MILRTLLSLAVTTLLVDGHPLKPDQEVVQLYGSGTAVGNTGKILLNFVGKSTPFVSSLFRTVGNTVGPMEFLATNNNGTQPVSDYELSDVPLSSAAMAQLAAANVTVLHYPAILRPLSVFVNLPGVTSGAGSINLSPCTLAGIFAGNITRWGDAAIAADNPGHSVIKGFAAQGAASPVIRNYRYVNGLGFNWAFANYLERSCPDGWPDALLPVGLDTINWPGKPSSNVTTFTAMFTALLNNLNSIGYLESAVGRGYTGLSEVNIRNKAGRWVTSVNSTMVNETQLSAMLPQELTSPDWSNVMPVWQDGKTQHPIYCVMYFIIRKNLTYLGDAGTWLYQFTASLSSDKIAQYLTGVGYVVLPLAMRRKYQSQFDAIVTTGAKWTYESTTFVNQSGFAISENRDTYVATRMQQLLNTYSNAATSLALGTPYHVHGSGTVTAAPFFQAAMNILMERSHLPVVMTYRSVTSVQAQNELLLMGDMWTQYNHFKVGEIPLSRRLYTELTTTPGVYFPPTSYSQAAPGGVAHLPFAIGSVSVFHNQPVPFVALRLDACLLARIYSGDITTWNHPDLAALNGWDSADLANSALIDSGIVVYAYASASSNTQTFYQFLRKACSTLQPFPLTPTDPDGLGTTVSWRSAVVQTRYQDLPIVTPGDMAAAIAGTRRAIGFVRSAIGQAAGLQEALLRNLAGVYVTSSDADLTAAVLAAPLPSATADWSGVDLLYLPGQFTWPMVTLQYIFVYPNLVPYGVSGPLTVALLNFTFSPEGQALIASTGLRPLPGPVLQAVRAALPPQGNVLTVAPLSQAWDMEQADQFSPAGMGVSTFSGNRVSYFDQAAQEAQQELDKIDVSLTEQLSVILRVAGPVEATVSSMVVTALAQLSNCASLPIKTIYEPTPSSAAAAMLVPVDPTRPDSAPAHLLVASQPLTAAEQDMLAGRGVQVLQAPFLVRPVVLSYHGISGVYFSACSVYGILSGAIATWSHPSLVVDNPSIALPAHPLKLIYPSTVGGDLQAVIKYAQRLCPSGTAPITLPSQRAEMSASDVASLVLSAPSYTNLGILTPAISDSFGLAQAAVQAGAGNELTKRTAATDNTTTYTNQLELAFSSQVGLPKDPLGLWTSLTLPLPSAPAVYPILRTDFIMVAADLIKYGDTAGAIQGLFAFLTSYVQIALIPRNAPTCNPLGTLARQYITGKVLPRIKYAAGTPLWPLLSSSLQTTSGAQPIVLSRFTYRDVFQVGASPSAALNASLSATLTAVGIEQVAEAAYRQAIAPLVQASSEEDAKLDSAYAMAVTALTLTSVLLAVTIGAAVVMLRSPKADGSEWYQPDSTPIFHAPSDIPLRESSLVTAPSARLGS